MNVFLVVAGVWCLPAVLITVWILADRHLDQRADRVLDLPVDDVWGDYYSSTGEPIYWLTVAAHERGQR
jgi:hypothetical protein